MSRNLVTVSDCDYFMYRLSELLFYSGQSETRADSLMEKGSDGDSAPNGST